MKDKSLGVPPPADNYSTLCYNNCQRGPVRIGLIAITGWTGCSNGRPSWNPNIAATPSFVWDNENAKNFRYEDSSRYNALQWLSERSRAQSCGSVDVPTLHALQQW